MEQDIVSPEEAEIINNLTWQRPEEISLKVDIIGFFQLNREGNEEEIDEC